MKFFHLFHFYIFKERTDGTSELWTVTREDDHSSVCNIKILFLYSVRSLVLLNILYKNGSNCSFKNNLGYSVIYGIAPELFLKLTFQ